MPIRIPDALPATSVLQQENVFVMTETQALKQDIRPLKVIILNLMPKKIETENQIMRLLSNSPLQVDIELLRIDNRTSKNTPSEHLNSFYRNFEQIKQHNYDGLIITGAPLGLVAFEDVVYWPQVDEIIQWSRTHVTSTLFLCWAAQAGLKSLYGLPKQTRSQKLSGIYRQNVNPGHDTLTRGFDDHFLAPQSRTADFPVDYIQANTDLIVLAQSDATGAYLMTSEDRRQVYVTGHPEYSAHTLANEYHRDQAAGLNPMLPINYFPNDDVTATPRATWRSHGHLFFSNWLNYCVYQATPFDLKDILPSQD
ncbi:MAG: homoserine O-succinyltransferase [Oceanospirillaceae bacterium]|jgi:homoserine O-succinyltransferase|nr:homoserine O-succinyltransferase [Oceanospirillaceae bacterium]MBT4442476.1 homoserine O-succinyltransferase [Oceanospirillaceae bacterium]MBT6077610.1 homoserine O-succinyltransferase [Oceanospirillaceae bacterium]